MKCLNQMILIIFVLCLSFFTEIVNAAPDKFGNGGAVWACETQAGEITDLMLIDIDEARRETKLTVPETNLNHIPYLQDKKDWIRSNLSVQFILIPHIDYVEQNISWIDGEMILVPDIKQISMPSPTLCKGGRWTAKTVVNFGDDGRVLGSKELFNSPFLTEMERTALYLHEGIYSYMRTEFNDQNSVRSRQIVGLIMSDRPDAEKVERINKLFGATPVPSPTPDPQIGGYICGLRPTSNSPLYTAEKKTEAEARTSAIAACKDGEKIGGGPFPFPFEGFPGFPGVGEGGPGFPGGGGELGPERECKAAKVACEAITSSQKRFKCTIKDFSGDRKYEGTGRTRLEAQKEAANICLASGESDYTCYSARKMDCN